MALWDDVITERDELVLQACGYGRVRGLGERPALLVIDMNYNWVGDRREPVLESIKRIRHSCGEEAWDAVDVTRTLIDRARGKRIPIVYTTGIGAESNYESKRRPWKNHRHEEDQTKAFSQRMDIVREIAPAPSDIVIRKLKPSAFFGTPLHSVLSDYRVDTLIVTGGSTSGCVRASVVDAFSYNYFVAVVEEGTFDRIQISHKANLLDMNIKYADVMKAVDVLRYLDGLPVGLYEWGAVPNAR
ncbi:MAG TPA: isochorismatase family protein [Candidatus Eisenbacteria bacterium]|nr:isochorismatase family protein [Candidatus Eisenbacteria bacterium]